jgi:hypothetical protein
VLNPAGTDYVSTLTAIILLPFPYHMTGVWWELPPLSFGGHVGLFKLSSEHCFVSTRIAVTWTCDQLDWFSLIIIIIIIDTNYPFIRIPRERVS